jgi:hypothetical protein
LIVIKSLMEGGIDTVELTQALNPIYASVKGHSQSHNARENNFMRV